MRHIMLDLETLSSRPDATIVSIGAVRFDPRINTLGEEFYIVVDATDCHNKYGLSVEIDTLLWWMNQDPKAQSVLNDPTIERVSLALSLLHFSSFVRKTTDSILWGNGSTFDNVILRNAFDATRLKWPISHKHDYCYRTIRRMFPADEDERVGTYHNALDDAKHQAYHLMKVLSLIPWEREPK